MNVNVYPEDMTDPLRDYYDDEILSLVEFAKHESSNPISGQYAALGEVIPVWSDRPNPAIYYLNGDGIRHLFLYARTDRAVARQDYRYIVNVAMSGGDDTDNE